MAHAFTKSSDIGKWFASFEASLNATGPERDAAVVTSTLPVMNEQDRAALANMVKELETTKKAFKSAIIACIKAQPMREIVLDCVKELTKEGVIRTKPKHVVAAKTWQVAAGGVSERANLIAQVNAAIPTLEEHAALVVKTKSGLENINKNRGFADPQVEALFLIVYRAACHGQPIRADIADLLRK